jgi:methionine-gamma-lyase
MQRKGIDKTVGFSTRAVHGGNETDGETGAIRRPITMANNYELPYDPTRRG